MGGAVVTACVLAPAQSQCAGPTVLGGISITPTLFCVTVGNAFLLTHYPAEMLPKLFFPVLTAIC